MGQNVCHYLLLNNILTYLELFPSCRAVLVKFRCRRGTYAVVLRNLYEYHHISHRNLDSLE